MSKISLTFPDGASRKFDKGITGAELARSISKSLAKKAVALVLDGELVDPINADAQAKIITRNDPEALELIRHDAAHVMGRRPCHGRSRAGAISRHPGHHRSGDRQRLLL